MFCLKLENLFALNKKTLEFGAGEKGKETLEKEKLKLQIKKASLKVRSDSLKLADEFDDVIDDGLA